MSDAKKQPPPPPSRERRTTLSNQNLKQEIPESKSEEQPASPAPVEEEQEWVEPVDLQNGVAVEKEDLLPNKYKYYRVWVEGTEEDIVDITFSKIVHTAATSIFVNFPGNENWPTKDFHDWNPTQVTLQGPVGEYKVAVYAVPSYIDKDDKWLIDPNNNRASYDLSVEWYLLDEEAKANLKKMEQQFKREKTSAVWASAYSSELVDKYQKQTEEIEQENAARSQQVGGASEINLDGTAVTKSYTLGVIIGRGDFSVVKKAKRNSDGKEVAIKIIDKQAAKEAGFDENILKRQTEICQGLDSPNVVKFIESFDTDKATCIVSESLEGGEIIHKLAEKVDQPYSEDTARKIVIQLLKAVEHLHSKNVVHKNIVPRNILFKTKDLTDIALVGFTLSQIVKGEDEVDVFGGDAGFQAPELLQRQGFGKGVDLWAIGVVTYILLSGYRPFQDTNTMRLYAKIRQGQYELPDTEWKSVSSEAKDFIQKLLNVEPSARITVQDALKHSWVTGKVDNKLSNVRKNLTKYED